MARDSFWRLLEEAAQCNYSYAKKFVVWELKMWPDDPRKGSLNGWAKLMCFCFLSDLDKFSVLTCVLSLEEQTNKTYLTRFLNVHHVSLENKVNIEWGSKMEIIFTPCALLTHLLHSQGQIPWAVVNKNLILVCLQHSRNLKRDSVASYMEEKHYHLGCGLL